MKKRALITGITGMDGSHLADFLLSKNYDVFGLVRRVSTPNLTNIEHICQFYPKDQQENLIFPEFFPHYQQDL